MRRMLRPNPSFASGVDASLGGGAVGAEVALRGHLVSGQAVAHLAHAARRSDAAIVVRHAGRAADGVDADVHRDVHTDAVDVGAALGLRAGGARLADPGSADVVAVAVGGGRAVAVAVAVDAGGAAAAVGVVHALAAR